MKKKQLKIKTPNLDTLEKINKLLGSAVKTINSKRLYVSVDVISNKLLTEIKKLGCVVSSDKQYDEDSAPTVSDSKFIDHLKVRDELANEKEDLTSGQTHNLDNKGKIKRKRFSSY